MFVIRQATLSDAPAISALLQDLTQRFVAADCTTDGAALLLQSMSTPAIAGYLQQANFDYLLAEADSALIGVAATRDNNHLYHLFVASERQGQGVATKLFAEAKARCLQRAQTRTFTVNASLKAVSLYQRLGFVAVDGLQQHQGIVSVPMRLELMPD